MAYINYTPHSFSAKSRVLIGQCNSIIEDYQSQGYRLTLRQLYYRLVAAALIPNKQEAYNMVGSVINDARLAGMVDWDAIEDRTRNLSSLPHWDEPADIILASAQQFRIEKWENQDTMVEVWVEKEALAGIVARVAERNDVGYLACRGYMSQSEMHVAALRILGYMARGQDVQIIHLGDHDPSGIDMTRDIQSRLNIFVDHHNETGQEVNVNRIALNMDQIEQYNPPPNPAKTTDSRFQAYLEEYGDESWELDALPPDALDELIEINILALRNEDLWDEKCEIESDGREGLLESARRWEDVRGFLDNGQAKEVESGP